MQAAMVVNNAMAIDEYKKQASGIEARLRRAVEEINHRVKNNLQSISDLLWLQSQALTKGEAKEALDDARSRVQNIAQIHKSLLQGDELNEVNLLTLTKNIAESIDLLYKGMLPNVEVTFLMEDVQIAPDTAKSLGSIINELITNAYKHGFRNTRHPALFVTFKNCGSGTWKLAVKNNGIAHLVAGNSEKANSLGMLLVREYAAQLNGILKSYADKLTIFEITFTSINTSHLNGKKLWSPQKS